MESTTVKLYSLNYGNVRTYLAASLFIVGNILFPQFFHLIPQGGKSPFDIIRLSPLI